MTCSAFFFLCEQIFQEYFYCYPYTHATYAWPLGRVSRTRPKDICIRFTGRFRYLTNRHDLGKQNVHLPSPKRSRSLRRGMKRTRPQISTREVKLSMRKPILSLSILLYAHLRIIFSRTGIDRRRADIHLVRRVRCHS